MNRWKLFGFLVILAVVIVAYYSFVPSHQKQLYLGQYTTFNANHEKMVLTIHPHGIATLMTTPANQTSSVIESGQWTVNRAHHLVVELTHRGNQALPEEDVIVFKLKNVTLQAVNFDHRLYGGLSSLSFTKTPEER